jgi:His/Glu/Gln/Arg/opine family amino acid ABC transporter permease subunit
MTGLPEAGRTERPKHLGAAPSKQAPGKWPLPGLNHRWKLLSLATPGVFGVALDSMRSASKKGIDFSADTASQKQVIRMLEYLEAGWGWQFVRAFGVSLMVAIFSFVFSIMIGIVLAIFASSRVKGAPFVVRLYTYVFRSLPDILLLILIFYTADGILNSLMSAIPGMSHIKVSPLVPGIMSTSIVLGAYSTELFKSGWSEIPAGQHEAGSALGFSGLQSLGLIILPQVYRKMIPHLSSLWLISMKETALLSIIGISDIVRIASLGARSTGAPITFYGIAIAIFIIFAFVSAKLFHRLERRSRQSMGGV